MGDRPQEEVDEWWDDDDQQASGKDWSRTQAMRPWSVAKLEYHAMVTVQAEGWECNCCCGIQGGRLESERGLAPTRPKQKRGEQAWENEAHQVEILVGARNDQFRMGEHQNRNLADNLTEGKAWTEIDCGSGRDTGDRGNEQASSEPSWTNMR